MHIERGIKMAIKEVVKNPANVLSQKTKEVEVIEKNHSTFR